MNVDGSGPGPIPLVPESAAKYLIISSIALTLYDYTLLFNDEIRYVWRGRKTWIFYLYILNRMLLVWYQVWQIYYMSSPNHSETLQLAAFYGRFFLIMFSLFSSDVFVTLRIYAVTLGNKIVVAYFGVLAVARVAMALITACITSPAVVENLQFKLIPNTIGTAFEASAILVIIWYTYQNNGSIKLTGLIRKVVAAATVYFFVMVAAQVFIQLSFNLIKGPQLSLLAYGLFSPILTLRFALSLRKSADPEGAQEWQMSHFSSPQFARPFSSSVELSSIRDTFEMDPIGTPCGRVQMC